MSYFVDSPINLEVLKYPTHSNILLKYLSHPMASMVDESRDDVELPPFDLKM